MKIHIKTRPYAHIYIYIYMCVCVCASIWALNSDRIALAFICGKEGRTLHKRLFELIIFLLISRQLMSEINNRMHACMHACDNQYRAEL